MVLCIDVISDVICPWCYIGKRRLEKAVVAFDGPVKVRWLPFQLNPTLPTRGISRRDYRTARYGSWERSQEIDARVVAIGEREGIHFAFDRIERIPNTLDTHCLIWLADKQGVQDSVVEALFLAYFTEGRDISNRNTLLDVVAKAGLNRRKAEFVLNNADGLEAIRQADALAQRFEIGGVPFFIVNGTLILSGAEQPDTFLATFRQALAGKSTDDRLLEELDEVQ